MDERKKETLRSCRVQLAADLTVDELWDPLVQVGLFTPNELKRITHSSEEPMTRLLDGLEQKGPMALHNFKIALENVNKSHLLDLLNQNNGGEGRIVEVDESDLRLLLKIEKNSREKKQELKDILNDACQLQPDGSFKITKEQKDLLLQELDNLNQFNKTDTIDCGARECICTEENVLCFRSSLLEAENEDLRKELCKVKHESSEKLRNVKKNILELLKPSDDQDDDDDDDDDETKIVDIKTEMNKLVLGIDGGSSFV